MSPAGNRGRDDGGKWVIYNVVTSKAYSFDSAAASDVLRNAENGRLAWFE